MKEAWYKNNTSSDLNFNDLGLRIPAHQTVNLFKIKPSLTMDKLIQSETEGLLAKCMKFSPPKVIKLPFAPPPKTYSTYEPIKEAKTPIPSRVKTAIVMDLKEKDFIEDLEENAKFTEASATRYANSIDGVGDPITLHSEGATFKAVTIPPIAQNEPQDAHRPVRKPTIKSKGKGNNQYLTVETEEDLVLE